MCRGSFLSVDRIRMICPLDRAFRRSQSSKVTAMAFTRLVSILGLAFGVATAAVAGGLQTPSPSSTSASPVQERLNRVRNDLFSPTPHVTDDVRELKEILGVDPQAVEAHLLLGMAYRAQGTQEMLAEAVAEFRQALEIKP